MKVKKAIRRLPRFGVVDGVIAPHPKGILVRLDDVLAVLDAKNTSSATSTK